MIVKTLGDQRKEKPLWADLVQESFMEVIKLDLNFRDWDGLWICKKSRDSTWVNGHGSKGKMGKNKGPLGTKL